MSGTKGRDIMAVYHFYSGDSIQQEFDEYEGNDAVTRLLNSLTGSFVCFQCGQIRQTKDIEKVVWSYC